MKIINIIIIAVLLCNSVTADARPARAEVASALRPAAMGEQIDGIRLGGMVFPYSKVPNNAQKGIDKTQRLLDYAFPVLFHKEFPLRLKDIVRYSKDVANAHAANGNIIITDYEVNPKHSDELLRILVHESLHLIGKGDKALRNEGLCILSEGIIEHFTRRIFEIGLAGQKGTEYIPGSQIYWEWSEQLRALLIKELFSGDESALIDFYLGGDIKRLKQAVFQKMQDQKTNVEAVFHSLDSGLLHELKIVFRRPRRPASEIASAV